MFPAVPRVDYLASILGDFAEARDRIAEMPVYAALNACRVYRSLLERAISSKEEAGTWALTALPADLRAVVANALAAYRGADQPAFDPVALRRFASEVDVRIRQLTSAP